MMKNFKNKILNVISKKWITKLNVISQDGNDCGL
jgi:hypothetical protein